MVVGEVGHAHPTEAGPAVTVVVCTYNPRANLWREVFEALGRQTLSQEAFEIVVVDNNSSPPVGVPAGIGNARVVREPKPGLNHARVAGIRVARAELLVFVDDDNILDPDYLERALRIAGDRPGLGAFGGECRGRLEVERLPRWKRRLLEKLGVREGGMAVESAEDKWGPWEPIGAGMVLRRPVAEEFVHLMETSPAAARLDRAGDSGLMSGGDTLMARCAYRVGLACAYRPELKLTHVIKRGRFEFRYLVRILHGHGRSVVVLDQALGKRVRVMPWWELVLRAPYRLLTRGVPGCVIYAWDLGYFLESRKTVR